TSEFGDAGGVTVVDTTTRDGLAGHVGDVDTECVGARAQHSVQPLRLRLDVAASDPAGDGSDVLKAVLVVDRPRLECRPFRAGASDVDEVNSEDRLHVARLESDSCASLGQQGQWVVTMVAKRT